MKYGDLCFTFLPNGEHLSQNRLWTTKETMTCPDDIGQALPLATLLPVQQKQACFVVRMGAGMEIILGPSGKGSHLPRLICLWPLSNTQPASNRDQMLGFQYGTIPVGNLPDSWWHVGPIPKVKYT